MISGYNNFPNDVESVFGDVIRHYNFHITIAEPDAVALVNDMIQIGFSINEDFLNMSIKSGGTFYNVTDIVPLIDKEFYKEWNTKLKAALNNLSREAYYKTYLMYYHQLSDKFLLNTYTTGVIPLHDYEKIQKAEDEKEAKFSIAWNAMQQLDYNNPIRQKYIAQDNTWIDDVMKLVDRKNN